MLTTCIYQPPSCRPTCPPPCRPPCPPLGTFNIAWSISFVPDTLHWGTLDSNEGHLILPGQYHLSLWTFDFVYSNIPIPLGTFDIVWSLSFVLEAEGTFDIFQAMSFVPETMVWFGHSRGVWSGLDTREAYSLVWTLERRIVWIGYSRGVWSGLDTREAYGLVWTLERCMRLREFIS